jgi:hypothetical protein
VAYPWLLQINTGFTGDFSMLLSNNANSGGTCFGDSGGPNFLGDSIVLDYVVRHEQHGARVCVPIDRQDARFRHTVPEERRGVKPQCNVE